MDHFYLGQLLAPSGEFLTTEVLYPNGPMTFEEIVETFQSFFEGNQHDTAYHTLKVYGPYKLENEFVQSV